MLFTGLNSSIAQWQPDVRLTNDPFASYTSNNNSWCIATSGDVVHVVWYDSRNGNDEIYYKRSTDGGVSWGADMRLTNAPDHSWFPSISVSGSIVHVLWFDIRDGNDEIYYKRSTDAGVSWGTDTRLTNNSAFSLYPCVSVSASLVHVVWHDTRDGNGSDEIYYKRSTDNGVSWSADTRLTNNSFISNLPSVSVSGQKVHVVWYDSRDLNREIYYKRSTDGGVSWEADVRLTNNSAFSWYPSITVSASVVHVVWYDSRDGNEEIYYKRSIDDGISWSVDTRLTNDPSLSNYPSVSLSDSVVHVVWQEQRDGNREIYYKRSTDGGVSWEADTRLTNNSSDSRLPSVSVSGQSAHVVWYDTRDGNAEIYYKRNPTGNIVGIRINNSGIPNEFSLRQNYPNPFNPSTTIEFSLPKSSFTKLVIYDEMGKEVQNLVNEQLNAGTYSVKLEGSKLSGGIYFYKLISNGFTETKKLILIK